MRKMKKASKSRIPFKIKLGISVGVVVIMGIVGFFMSPAGQAVIKMGHEMCLTIQDRAHLVLDQVVIEGHARTTQEDINNALNLTQGMPILDINPKEAREKLLALPWVKSVTVERHLPSTLFIRITEHKPIAIWQNNKIYLPLDEEGKPIQDRKTILSNLLLVVGKDAPEHTPALIRLLSEFQEDIGVKVRSAVRIGERRWNLILNDVENGLEIYLPETDARNALKRLSQENQRNQILKRNLKVIDIRLPDRFIIQVQKGGA